MASVISPPVSAPGVLVPAATGPEGRPDTYAAEASRRLLATFHRAAALVPAYRTILAEHQVQAADIRDVASFRLLCPTLSKSSTFNRFSLDDLSVGGTLPDIAEVLTSSGHGGRFSFGLSTREQAAAAADLVDAACDAAFQVASRPTLAINCLPMGVTISSRCMTVATTSVREDMAVALVKGFGHKYDQLLIVGDPLFMKRLMDHAAEQALDWRRYRVNVIVGEEICGERFRAYVASRIGVNLRDNPGRILSSFGVGELGLHLCYETAGTVALRRAAFDNPDFARALLGADIRSGDVLPMILTFDPLRTFIEIPDAGGDGYGPLTITMLDDRRTIPLPRYQTGDMAALLEPAHVRTQLARYGIPAPDALPRALLALRGRAKEMLPNGSHVGVYKDALYADHEAAASLTGAVRLAFTGPRCTMHVQRVPSASAGVFPESRLFDALPESVRPDRIVQWAYGEFPFGMSLDYERKFTYFVPSEPGGRQG